MTWHPQKGTFEPDELASLKAIFDEITGQPWFSKRQEDRESYAAYLIDTFPSGTYDARKHRSVVEASARMFYGLDDVD